MFNNSKNKQLLITTSSIVRINIHSVHEVHRSSDEQGNIPSARNSALKGLIENTLRIIYRSRDEPSNTVTARLSKF